MRRRNVVLAAGLAATLLSGCVLAAAGAGAGGAIYVTDRGVESVVPASVDQTFEAARRAFQDLGISETKSTSEQGAAPKRSLEGKTSDREVEVDLRTENGNTKVSVVAKKSAVTWDKDYARKILNRIVDETK